MLFEDLLPYPFKLTDIQEQHKWGPLTADSPGSVIIMSYMYPSVIGWSK